ncbi:hypothetical protein GGR42_002013 [Saonia flava]|uniref:Lipoprotein n=1 Tax=Saonia flava TaxID=523696 RepID=A0A846QTM7_9FLAO|nr:hypothetical protein [Saonia flava]NJB71551.1 hypothetical protein [Saonia flava]
MKRLFFYMVALFAAITLGSCSLDNDDANFEFAYLQIVEVEVPESFDVNDTYQINVTYLRSDECTFFQGFDVIKVDQTTREVVVVGSVFTDQTTCVEVNQEVQTSFDFQVLYSDTYHFKFWSGEDENGNPQFIEVDIPVN